MVSCSAATWRCSAAMVAASAVGGAAGVDATPCGPRERERPARAARVAAAECGACYRDLPLVGQERGQALPLVQPKLLAATAPPRSERQCALRPRSSLAQRMAACA